MSELEKVIHLGGLVVVSALVLCGGGVPVTAVEAALGAHCILWGLWEMNREPPERAA